MKKRKKTKWEKIFIKDYGREIYAQVLRDIPELKRKPKYFESLVKLWRIADKPIIPLDDNGGESNGQD